ncbi:unnamed protein product [Chondrus crispus]|uniref:Uncharacterized protein n=1 Tax=Chondrus crispus TaxID=2769 RepID=R7QEM6_CHOCR|nr:unnamed protein product [Chondrus crispus]CDF36238.1 unnamed protein product [Chondrus crispus]|eukprot:XP_005716057.1 unnamed protein product [Chondrus crispus]
MAVPGILGEYIAKNYRRLLICVAPPPPERDPQLSDNDDPPRPRRRRSSNTRRSRARRSGRVNDGNPVSEERRAPRMVREDPFRGCVQSRQSDGPRRSGDFVILGCMQV